MAVVGGGVGAWGVSEAVIWSSRVEIEWTAPQSQGLCLCGSLSRERGEVELLSENGNNGAMTGALWEGIGEMIG